MARTAANKKHFTFVKGLNTEGGPLTVVPNTWAEGDNIIPEMDGSIFLRTGVDYEPFFELSPSFNATVESTGAFVVGEWNNVAGNGNLHFAVVQRGQLVYFYINSGPTISNQDKAFTIDLATYKAAGNPETSGVAPIATANVLGKLLIVSQDTEPLLVTYNPTADTITVSTITLKIRDFAGLDDGLAVDNRPVTLSAAHNYNLRNQGWSSTHITSYQAAKGVYPSNAQIWTAGKDVNDDFSPTILDKIDFGTSPAPKGRFVLDLFNRDRSTASGVGGITTETETYRPTTAAFFAGRAWYGGVRSNTIGTWVVFSQVAETAANLGKCYQDADPTSEVISDLIPTDGGVVPIQDAGTILKLLPFGNVLLVICDNGIWQIVGGADTGFAADAYEVRPLAKVGCVSTKAVVVTEKSVVFWAEDAIYAIQPNENAYLTIESVTAETIQTFFNEIPMVGKIFSSGTYIPEDRIIVWAYNDDELQDGVIRRHKKNRLLVFDLNVPCFYTHTIGELASNSPYFTDIFTSQARAAATLFYNVVDNSGNPVKDDLTTPDQVVATLNPGTANAVRLKFAVTHPVSTTSFNGTVAQFDTESDAPRKFRDWWSKDNAGVSYEGYIIPGYDFGAEGQGADRFFGALYAHVYMRRTETGVDSGGNPINPSGCLLQGRWDWADSNASNRWTQEQQVYRHNRLWNPTAPQSGMDDGVPVIVTKNKIRGRGRVLQLRLRSEPDKDMQLLGWAIDYSGNEST